MRESLQENVKIYMSKHRSRKVFRKFVQVMSCIVAFVTTYALILPAITMEKKTFCGLDEHTHSTACYQQQVERRELICSPAAGLHVHSAACYHANGSVICGAADYLIHSHDDSCRNEAGALVCTLPERSQHTHGSGCYVTPDPVPHVHGESCMEPVKGDLICTQQVSEGHRHGDGCYTVTSDLTCTKTEGHQHDDHCYETPLDCTVSTEPHYHDDTCYIAGAQICETPENHVHQGECFVTTQVCNSYHGHESGCYESRQVCFEEHEHTDGCWENALVCGYGDEGHPHTDSCYATETVCHIPEGHTHTATCFEQNLNCGKADGEVHTHVESCYSTRKNLTCELDENHSHDDSCYRREQTCEIPESEGHAHGDDCYRWDSRRACGLEEGQLEEQEPELVCAEPAASSHTHGAECFETKLVAADPICGETHEHTHTCYQLTCILLEHIHSAKCFSDPAADVESREYWESTMKDLELTEDWHANVVAVAESQLGYTESKRNYDIWEDGSQHGYTRYGAWYGVPHGDWCGMFASFCLEYAGVKGMPYDYGVRPWIEKLSDPKLDLYRPAEEYTPVPGDLVFFDWDQDKKSDHVGIVYEIIDATEEEPAKLKTIEGNSQNCVQFCTYDLDSEELLGYSMLPENPDMPVYICGLEPHAHTEECYDGEGNPICQIIAHQHEDSCIQEPAEEEIYYCGLEVHTHDANCVDEEGNSICELAEHTHEDACLVEPPVYHCGLEEHTHGENCVDEEGNTICELTEHIHEDACLVEPPVYYCGLEEHTHDENCVDEEGNTICELTEHTHEDACLVAPPVYHCGLEEHTHDENCVDEEGNTICELTEHTHEDACLVEPSVYHCGLAPHEHNEECYDEEGNLTCELPEHEHSDSCLLEFTYYCGLEAHTHEEAQCYDSEGKLTCKKPEHVHDEACLTEPKYTCGKEAHNHAAECYDAEGKLSCQLDEHSHSYLCLGYTCGMEVHTHVEACYDENGNLSCMLPEHSHDQNCDNYVCGLIPHEHSERCYDPSGNVVCGMEEHAHSIECLEFRLAFRDESISVTASITGVEGLPEDLTLKVWQITSESDPDTYGSMSVAVSRQMSSDEQFLTSARFYQMQLLSQEEPYELPKTAVVKVDAQFADPVFTKEEVSDSVDMQAFTLTPDPDQEPPTVQEEPDNSYEEIPQEEPTGSYGRPVSFMDTENSKVNTIRAVTLKAVAPFFSWRPQVAFALENVEDVTDTGDTQAAAYMAESADEEDIRSNNMGVMGLSFQSNGISAFAVALAENTVTGDYWLRVDDASQITSDGVYMIVSGEGNYALRGDNSNNYVPVTIEAVKSNESYYTISNTDNNLRWKMTSGNGGYTIQNVGSGNYLFLGTITSNRKTYSYVIYQTSASITLTPDTYSKSQGVFWKLKRSDNNLTNAGGKFDFSQFTNWTSQSVRETSNMLLFKLQEDLPLTIPADVTIRPSFGTDQAGDVVDPNEYDPFVTPSGEKTGGTAVANSEGTEVEGTYYSDPATSDLESKFRPEDYDSFDAHKPNNGKVLTDKSVIYKDDDYNAFQSYEDNTFGVTLSALGQAYQLSQQDVVKVPVDVVFVLDVSGSMEDTVPGTDKNRIEHLVNSVNTAMKQILDASEENRVGIALYSSGASQMLPLDRYEADNDVFIECMDSDSSASIQGTETLKNDDGRSFKGIGPSDFDSLGTFTQAGIAAGYEIFEENDETDYTFTIGTGEAARTYTVQRQPVFVLVSDGEPTHCTNVYNDPLNGPFYGDGTSKVDPNGKGIMGYYTVLSANYFKRMIGIHYGTPAHFYTIGIGIAETGKGTIATTGAEYDGYKRAVLNPISANLNDTTNVSYYNSTTGMMKQMLEETYTASDYVTVNPINSYYGDGKWMSSINADVPVLKDHPYSNNYDYADKAYFGVLSETDLNAVFNEILSNSIRSNPYGFILYQSKSSVELTDHIGMGMEVKGLQTGSDGSVDLLAPQLLYADRQYAPSSITTSDNVTTITYDWEYSDPVIPNRKVRLSNIKVTVVRDANGNQTVQMYVPDVALPVFTPDATGTFYYESLPVRLIYQVGLTEESRQKVLALSETGGGLTFYTNRHESNDLVASSILYPDEENPYYFDLTTKEPRDVSHVAAKTSNTTQTYGNSVTCSTADYETTIHHTHLLGNNGKLVFGVENVRIDVEKKWDSQVSNYNRPEVEIILYSVHQQTNVVTEISRGKLNEGNSWKTSFQVPPPNVKGVEYYLYEPVKGFAAVYEHSDTLFVDGKLLKVGQVVFDGNTGQAVPSVVTNYVMQELPETGGSGGIPYTAGGTLLTCAALFLLYNKIRKRRRGAN